MKHIVLIDFSLEGHHLSFIRSFCKILLEKDCCVSCIVPEFEKVQKWVLHEIPSKAQNFKGYTYNFVPKEFKLSKKINVTLGTLYRWSKESEMIKKIEYDRSLKVDLVFFAWLDYQLAPYIPGFLLKSIFPFKWSGLYFHPYHLRQSDIFLNRKANWRDQDAIFLSKNCISVAIHDSAIKEKFSKRIGKPVIHFPETADATLPDFSNVHFSNIKEKANGRLVVGMIGCEKHKGTLTLMRMAKEADDSKYFFAFVGTLPKETYNESEWNEAQEFIELSKENCYFFFHSIEEGAAYNAVFSSFDIPFLVYDNFISSSNRLTKAAIFKKLVLASDNYCVGDDVRKFSLGEAVKPKDYLSALIGLEKLSKRITNQDFPLKQWEEYRNLNSDKMLGSRFEEILELI